MNVNFSYFPKIWLINNTIIFNLIKSVSIIKYNYYIITLLLKLVGRYKNNYLVTHSESWSWFILSVKYVQNYLIELLTTKHAIDI